MTTTRSQVTRKTEHSYATLYSKPRPIIVRIAAGDILEFRELGLRTTYRMSIQTGFRYAVQLSAMKIARRIKELRKAGVPKAKARKQAEREVLG